jgi:DNA-binding transcriptional regulator YdaS (Cro superfamily)
MQHLRPKLIGPIESDLLITAAGGDQEFAKLIGLPIEPGVKQRVNNWKRIGIPNRIAIEHAKTINKVRRKAKALRAAFVRKQRIEKADANDHRRKRVSP